MNLKSKVLVVSHDAGGAEILSSFIFNYPKIHFLYYLEGPAKLIFNRKHPNINLEKELDDGLIKCDMILTGTSWQSNIEYIAIEKAKKIEEITSNYGISLKSAALNFLLSDEKVTSIVPGMSSIEEIDENISLAKESIPSELWSKLREANYI